MLTEACQDRLHNWKFERAAQLLTSEATQEERELVTALAVAFGSPGWFEGSLGIIVGAVVNQLTGHEDEDLTQ